MVKGKKIAIGAGIAGAVGALIYFATRAKAEPPPPPPGLANLYGVVTDANTGQPIPDVLVTLNGLEAHTDSAGNYTFEELEPGEYVLQFSKAGYQPATY